MSRLTHVPSVPSLVLEESARETIQLRQVMFLVLMLGLVVAFMLIGAMSSLVALIGIIMGLFAINTMWRLAFAVLAMRGRGRESPTGDDAFAAIRQNPPLITAMIPVYRESAPILRRLATSLEVLDYPPGRLQVLILLDADQRETIEAAIQSMPSRFEILAIEPVAPRTKPRVLNDGLRYAQGEYVVVWDVEDEPDPQQLLKAMVVLEDTKVTDPSVLGVQGKLAFDLNMAQRANLLMKWQAASYNLQFEGFLPALDRLRLPVPLGGTSNVFRTRQLREIGGWDAWNVTEDMDLGVRLARHGYRMRMIDSTTWEEPNPRLGNCLRQWSRWKKGAMQTYLVHMRRPVRLGRDLGLRGWLSFQFTVGLPVFILLLNPVFVFLTMLYVYSQPEWIKDVFPPVSLYLGNFCLIAGNFLFLFATATASLRREQYGLVPAAFLSFGHWLLMSVAAYMGLWQLVSRRAHVWEATTHGHLLTLPPTRFRSENGASHAGNRAQVDQAGDPSAIP